MSRTLERVALWVFLGPLFLGLAVGVVACLAMMVQAEGPWALLAIPWGLAAAYCILFVRG